MSKDIFIDFKTVGTALTVTASYDNGKITATATGDCPEKRGSAWRKRLDELIDEAGGEVKKQIAAAEGRAA
jgi:hypothetical protein